MTPQVEQFASHTSRFATICVLFAIVGCDRNIPVPESSHGQLNRSTNARTEQGASAAPRPSSNYHHDESSDNDSPFSPSSSTRESSTSGNETELERLLREARDKRGPYRTPADDAETSEALREAYDAVNRAFNE